MPTLLTLRTRLRKRIGGPVAGDVTDQSLTDYLNDAYAEVADSFPFLRTRGEQVIPTVAGTAQYTLAVGTNIVREVWDKTNGKRLDKVSEKFVAQSDFASQTNAKPTKYFRFQDKIRFFPPPDAIYQITVSAVLDITALAADGDTPVLPVSWHRGILLLATYMYYSDEAKDLQKAAVSKNEYKDWLSTKTTEVAEERKRYETGVEMPTLGGDAAPRSSFDTSS